jgi:hypothetical protein
MRNLKEAAKSECIVVHCSELTCLVFTNWEESPAIIFRFVENIPSSHMQYTHSLYFLPNSYISLHIHTVLIICSPFVFIFLNALPWLSSYAHKCTETFY